MRITDSTMSLGSAREIVRAARFEKDGVECPCCGQFAKVYRRSVTLTEVKVLAKIYNVARKTAPGAPTDVWVKAGTGGPIKTYGGDFAKARFWGLIEPQEGEREDGSKRVGMWRITERGIEFLLGVVRVPKYVWIYNNQQVAPPDGTPAETINVYDVARKFDFRAIMEAP